MLKKQNASGACANSIPLDTCWEDARVKKDASLSGSQRLATYGTLAPGEPNENQLLGLRGSWSMGMVRGRRVAAGWAAPMGYPGIVLDDTGFEISVQVFTSADLPAHWERLDTFEGHEYERQTVQVMIEGCVVAASIYAIRD